MPVADDRPFTRRQKIALALALAFGIWAAAQADAATTPAPADACAHGARIFIGAECAPPR